MLTLSNSRKNIDINLNIAVVHRSTSKTFPSNPADRTKTNKRLMQTGKHNNDTIHNSNTCHEDRVHHQTNDAQKYFPCCFITID